MVIKERNLKFNIIQYLISFWFYIEWISIWCNVNKDDSTHANKAIIPWLLNVWTIEPHYWFHILPIIMSNANKMFLQVILITDISKYYIKVTWFLIMNIFLVRVEQFQIKDNVHKKNKIIMTMKIENNKNNQTKKLYYQYLCINTVFFGLLHVNSPVFE